MRWYVGLTCFVLMFDTCSAALSWRGRKNPPAAKVDPKRPSYSSSCPIEIDLSLGVDNFRSLPEGSFEGNMGGYGSFNLKAPLGQAFFLQIGGSYGVYDWAGRSSTPSKNSKEMQQQGFGTGAFSYETPDYSGINFGIAYDGMWNKSFGLFATDPYLGQVRGQIGYLFRGGNEIGAWGTFNVDTAHKSSEQTPLQFHAVCQANLFWCHNFKNKAYLMFWGGTPYRKGLMYKSQRPGRYLCGARFDIPLTHSLSLNGHAAYMGAISAPDGIESRNYASNICFALTYAFGKRRMQKSHYMEIADNSNFIVDTNHNR